MVCNYVLVVWCMYVRKLPILSNLMYSMGNVNCADSQRQAASTLQVSEWLNYLVLLFSSTCRSAVTPIIDIKSSLCCD